jgi:hypothetical protein
MSQRTIHFSEIHTARVTAGEKRCTIRGPRKLPIAAGDTLKLRGPRFAGYGKAHPQPARLLRTATCTGVNEVVLHFAKDGSVCKIDLSGPPFCAPNSVAEFARMDGFKDEREMGRFFIKLYGPEPFKGILIRW